MSLSISLPLVSEHDSAGDFADLPRCAIHPLDRGLLAAEIGFRLVTTTTGVLT